MTLHRKFEMFQSLITPKLMYGLSSAWLHAADARRLDRFQARCCRKIARSKLPFISRVSNKAVLQKTQQQTCRTQLLRQQLPLVGKVASSANEDVLRRLTFMPGSLTSAVDRFMRVIGRPRKEWAKMMLQEATAMARSADAALHLAGDRPRWRQAVMQHFSTMEAADS